jgi:uncharacterized protein (DUF2252 family)
VFIRELLPQDLKLELEQLTIEEATAAAYYLTRVVGAAHVRQMDAGTRKAWRKAWRKVLHKRRRPDCFSRAWLPGSLPASCACTVNLGDSSRLVPRRALGG